MSTVPVKPLGEHLIAEFYGAQNLYCPTSFEPILASAAVACGATVLEINCHDFGERYGFTGVAILSESHISIHTWPEHNYAAIDIFLCGELDPQKALAVLAVYLEPSSVEVQVLKRGLSFISSEKDEVLKLKANA